MGLMARGPCFLLSKSLGSGSIMVVKILSGVDPFIHFLSSPHGFLILPHMHVLVSPKQWPLAPNSPKWQITRANVSRRVTFLLNTRQIRRSECIESGLSRVANLVNLANFLLGRFIYKKIYFYV